MSSTEISAGDTPEILDACPMLIGLYFFNFCLEIIPDSEEVAKRVQRGPVYPTHIPPKVAVIAT